jgi:hypothetical protein
MDAKLTLCSQCQVGIGVVSDMAEAMMVPSIKDIDALEAHRHVVWSITFYTVC